MKVFLTFLTVLALLGGCVPSKEELTNRQATLNQQKAALKKQQRELDRLKRQRKKIDVANKHRERLKQDHPWTWWFY